MQKRIAIINSVCGTGSTGRIVNDLTIFLRAKGFDARIFFGRNPNRFKAPYAKCFSNYLDFLVHCLKTRLFDKSGFSSNHVTQKLIKELNQFDPDLIILNNLHGYYLNINILFNWIKNKNKKIILVCHDCWNFTGHCTHFSLKNCTKWKNGCYNCPAKKEYPSSLLLDNSKRNYEIKKDLYSNIKNLTVVCPSNWLANYAKESFFSNREIVTIHNGVDTNLFKKTTGNFKKKYNLGNKKIILCIANMFDERKGLYDVIKLNQILSDNEVIVMVGQIKGKIEIPKNIIHIRRTDSIVQLVEIYSSCDVMFNPTYEDNYPTTNLEAISCDLPVVCYKTGGAVESVDEHFLVEQGDVDAAKSIMNKLFVGKIKYDFKKKDIVSKNIMLDKYLKLILKMIETENR